MSDDDARPGAEDEQDQAPEGQAEDAADGQDGQGGEDDEQDRPLGPAGEKALQAEKAKRRAEARRRRELEAELARLKAEREGADAVKEAERAALAKANARIVKAEIRAAAAGRLADPVDALAFIDSASFEVGENGEVDREEIAEAVADLLKRKPYLAAEQPRRFRGGADGGVRGRTATKSLGEQIREAEAGGDLMKALELKQRQLVEASKKK